MVIKLPDHEGIPGINVVNLLSFAADHGIDTSALIASNQLDFDKIDNWRSVVSAPAYKHMVRYVIEQYDRPGLGLLVGAWENTACLGILGHAMMCASTFQKAMNLFLQMQNCFNALLHVKTSFHDDVVVLSLTENIASRKVAAYEIERVFSELSGTIRRIVEKKARFSIVRLAHRQSAPKRLYSKIFGCPVEFDQPVNEIVITVDCMGLPLRDADTDIFRLCEQQCKAQMYAREHRLKYQIRKILVLNSDTFLNGKSELKIADYLGVSTRTLRRHLSDEGTTFRDTIDEVRIDIAEDYLRNSQMTPADIASQVGYSNVHGFYRAFKRRIGIPPMQFRMSFQV